jgi:hypothetical protein
VNLILRHSTTSISRNQALFRQFYLEKVPEWFPIHIDDATDNEDDLTLVTGRKKKGGTPNAKPNHQNTLANLNCRLISIEQAGRVWVVKYGRSGRRGTGVFFEFAGGYWSAKYA